MNIKIIVLVITIILMVVFTTGAILNNHNTTSTTIQEQRTNNLTDQMLMEEFTRIHQLPYEQYQCREKADLLTAYIYRYDKTGELYTVSVPYKDGTYSHVYVEYRGFVYDPTSTPTGKPLYRIDKALWQQQLTAWGFTGQPIVRYGHGGEVDTDD